MKKYDDTMSAVPNGAPSARGTIILDACTLLNFNAEASKPLRAHDAINTPFYLDIYPFLAHSGFRVVIPEIVALEAGCVFRDGKMLDSGLTKYAGASGKMLKVYLKRVANQEFPGISIVPSTCPEIKNFVGELRDTSGMAGATLEKYLKDRRVLNNGLKDRRALINMTRETSLRRVQRDMFGGQFGDMEIRHMTQHDYAPTIHAPPVFVISDDAQLLNSLAKDVHSISTRRLLHTLVANGLQEALALNPSIPAERFFQDAVTQARRHQRLVDDAQFDAGKIHDSFFNEIAGLARDREAAGAKNAITPQLEEDREPSPGMRRFLERQKKTKRIQEGTDRCP